MKKFADKLNDSVLKNKSVIIAGFDPQIENLPEFLLKKSRGIKEALVDFHKTAIRAISGQVAGVKINTAFFEQYGIEGLQAMQEISAELKAHNLCLIADAKRGDIGNTAKAYSNAFLGNTSAFGKSYNLIEADALTVNPFLGFDTLEAYLEDCINYGKGLFVLVKTSNPGSDAIQGLKNEKGMTASDLVAEWVFKYGDKLKGECGYSGLGAVTGATYPQDAVNLRKIMKNNFFLIPGYGAQGGTAKEATAGFVENISRSSRGGAVINISRALFASFSLEISDHSELESVITQRLAKFNQDINSELNK